MNFYWKAKIHSYLILQSFSIEAKIVEGNLEPHNIKSWYTLTYLKEVEGKQSLLQMFLRGRVITERENLVLEVDITTWLFVTNLYVPLLNGSTEETVDGLPLYENEKPGAGLVRSGIFSTLLIG